MIERFISATRDEHTDKRAYIEAPNDETAARLAVFLAGRDYVTSETLRCFSMDEMRALL